MPLPGSVASDELKDSVLDDDSLLTSTGLVLGILVALVVVCCVVASMWVRRRNAALYASDPDSWVFVSLARMITSSHSIIGLLTAPALERASRALCAGIEMSCVLAVAGALPFLSARSFDDGEPMISMERIWQVLLASFAGSVGASIVNALVVRRASSARPGLGVLAGMTVVSAAALLLPAWMDGYPFAPVVVAGVWGAAVVVSWVLYQPISTAFTYFVFYNVAIPRTGGLTPKSMRSNRVGPRTLDHSAMSSSSTAGWGSPRTEAELSSSIDDQ